jgi:DNA-binding transcriptional ArsR family regulator
MLLVTTRNYPRILQSTAYVQVLLAVAAGVDYSSAIAKVLTKTQPTVSAQLMELKAAGLVKAGERGKAQKYVINWSPLVHELYYLMRLVLEERKSYRGKAFMTQVRRVGFDRIVPPGLLKEFLRRYFVTLRELNGIQKTFNEILISLFKSIDELKLEELRSIAEHFNVDSLLLKDVSALIGLEADHVELTALESIADELRKRTGAGPRARE